jgi:hypothetical protein
MLWSKMTPSALSTIERIRHAYFIERTFGETRHHHVKVIGRLPGQASCLNLDRAGYVPRLTGATTLRAQSLHESRAESGRLVTEQSPTRGLLTTYCVP